MKIKMDENKDGWQLCCGAQGHIVSKNAADTQIKLINMEKRSHQKLLLFQR